MAPKRPKEPKEPPPEEPAPEEAPPTQAPLAGDIIVAAKPDLCRVVGEGLRKVAVKQYGCFTIEAYDENGERKMTGGDAFFIAIRGACPV